jgi:hypothetical protein
MRQGGGERRGFRKLGDVSLHCRWLTAVNSARSKIASGRGMEWLFGASLKVRQRGFSEFRFCRAEKGGGWGQPLGYQTALSQRVIIEPYKDGVGEVRGC